MRLLASRVADAHRSPQTFLRHVMLHFGRSPSRAEMRVSHTHTCLRTALSSRCPSRAEMRVSHTHTCLRAALSSRFALAPERGCLPLHRCSRWRRPTGRDAHEHGARAEYGRRTKRQRARNPDDQLRQQQFGHVGGQQQHGKNCTPQSWKVWDLLGEFHVGLCSII